MNDSRRSEESIRTSSPRSSAQHDTRKPPVPKALQSKTARGETPQQSFMNGLEREFKVKHLSLLGVFGWLL